MLQMSYEASAKKHAQEVRARLYGKPQREIKPKPVLLIAATKPPRIDVDCSYHVVLFRMYQFKQERAQERMKERTKFRVAANFTINPVNEYGPPVQVLDFSYASLSPPRRTMLEITEEVLKDFPDVTLEMLRGTRRTHDIVKPRHMAMYAVWKERTDLSYPAIGRFFSADHSSVINCIKKMKARLEGDPEAALWLSRKSRQKAARRN